MKDFLDLYDVALIYIGGPKYLGPSLQENIWGVRRKNVKSGEEN